MQPEIENIHTPQELTWPDAPWPPCPQANVFPHTVSWASFAFPLGPLRGPAPTVFLFTGRHDLCGLTERNLLPTNPSLFKPRLVIIDPQS